MKQHIETKYCVLDDDGKGIVKIKTKWGTYYKGDKVKSKTDGFTGKIISIMVRNENAVEIIPNILIYNGQCQHWYGIDKIQKA